jgi:acyl phosphate:glycerol-3-phosphate acyltransferase
VPVWTYIIVAVAAYLLGSIPTGFLVGRARGIDIRTVGSGNIGATNTMRVLGKPAGIFVLLADCLKGYAACTWLLILVLKFITVAPENVATLQIVAGIFAVLGHNYTCWLKFKGGKGIATTTGVYLALAPWAVLIGLVVFLLAVLATRYVSVGSIAAAIALPLAICLTQNGWLLDVVTIALAVLAIYKHKSNIQRLRNGTENRIMFKKKDSQ